MHNKIFSVAITFRNVHIELVPYANHFLYFKVNQKKLSKHVANSVCGDLKGQNSLDADYVMEMSNSPNIFEAMEITALHLVLYNVPTYWHETKILRLIMIERGRQLKFKFWKFDHDTNCLTVSRSFRKKFVNFVWST